jgi:hypothetical protein
VFVYLNYYTIYTAVKSKVTSKKKTSSEAKVESPENKKRKQWDSHKTLKLMRQAAASSMWRHWQTTMLLLLRKKYDLP